MCGADSSFIVDYDGEVSQCVPCGHIADSSEFENGCPECGSEKIIDFEGSMEVWANLIL